MSTRYRRIHSSEVEENTEEEMNKKKRAERVDKITAKLHAIVWVLAAIVSFIFSDVVKIGLYDKRVNRWEIINVLIYNIITQLNFLFIVYLISI